MDLLLVYMEELVEKGRTHKYIKRVPYFANGKKRYRYYYKMPSGGLVSKKDLEVGSAFQYGSGDSRAHYKITAVEGDKITVQHTESGDSRTLSFEQLKEFLDNDRLEQADDSKKTSPELTPQGEEQKEQDVSTPESSSEEEQQGTNESESKDEDVQPVQGQQGFDFATADTPDFATAETPESDQSSGFNVRVVGQDDRPMDLQEMNQMMVSYLQDPKVDSARLSQKIAEHFESTGSPPSRAQMKEWAKEVSRPEPASKREPSALRAMFPTQGSDVERAKSYLKSQLASNENYEISALPADKSDFERIPYRQQLLENANVRELGKGAFGQVFGWPGPPPAAFKYGKLTREDLEIGAIAGELGIGAKIYGGVTGRKIAGGEDPAFEGRMAMELFSDHSTIWDNMAEKGFLNPQNGRISDTDEGRRYYAQLNMKVMRKLQVLHMSGYSHNDTHLGNALIDSEGELKLIDYGLARQGYDSAYAELSSYDYSAKLSSLNALGEERGFKAMKLLDNVLRASNDEEQENPYDANKIKAKAILRFYEGLEKILGEEYAT